MIARALAHCLPWICLLWIAPLLQAGAAAPELCARLPPEDQLEARWEEIEALWRSHARDGVFDSPAQLEAQPENYRVNPSIRIAWAALERPEGLPNRGTIVIASGRTEAYLKYRELAATLWCAGFAVYMIDHRGQGLSSRVLVFEQELSELSSGETPVQYANRGHVVDFDHYVRDLEYFVEHIVPARKPRVLLAHSMGGAIGLRLIQQRPDLFDLAVLSSPMLGVPVQFACSGIASLGELAGADAYIPGGGPWIHEERYPYRDDWGFQATVAWHYTSSAVRHDLWHREFAEPRRAADGREQDLRIGAPTLGWFTEACAAVEQLREHARRVSIPVLLLIAEDDTVIPQRRQREVCDAMNGGESHCRAVLIEDARHEMFIEVDAVRERLLREVFGFISHHLEQR